MGWFATRRELKRLAASEKFWRERALALEAKLEKSDSLRFEREIALLDRCLTRNGQFAVADEARQKASLGTEKQEKDELNTYLQERYNEIQVEARAAGVDMRLADAKYKEMESQFVEDFQNTF